MAGWFQAVVVAILLGGCATAATSTQAADSLDAVARDYVQLTLEIGEREEGYVDAYYGPAEWREAAQANPRTVAELAQAAASLHARLTALSVPTDPLVAARRDFLLAQLTAARTRLRMAGGERLSFAEEARGLYGVDPEILPLEHYDPILGRIDTLVPGSGPLADRVEAFQNRFVVPADRLEPVMRAAIDECRRRTLAHIPLPEAESFTLEFVTDRSWSGYNWYQGGYRSLIQVNTDLPVRLSRAVDLGCHEGYPGHHAYNVLLERDLARGRGWVEYQVYPLYSPQSFIAEGSANYGIELAFPGDERLAFETQTLYPLAGLPIDQAADYIALQEALQALSGARFTIARDYLEGRISRDQAIALTERYQLVSERRAEQSVAFTDQYRAYVINYGLGRDMVARHVEAAGADPAARWAAMRRILSEPTLPSDLVRAH
ncbi:hypothetical protein [Sphingosinicella sp. CPCC 101087]|uniref:hypothetical protein n=1 Tax=Sphingosinicella sp. CPCC 101087 TaxID=2497754 RepID=UPI001FB13F9A|nr:hypothetical protein [Sphingosinicella sp. CPCC 101087]